MKQITLAIILGLLLVGCGNSRTECEPSRFGIIDRGADYNVIVDRDTGIEYLITTHGITCLLDHDGKPFVANGWRDYD